MSSNAKDQITRLLAILGSIVVMVGVNVRCVWIGSFYINPSPTRKEILSLAEADWRLAILILTLTGIICGATFVKSHRALWIWLGAVLLAAAIPLAWWHLNRTMNVSLQFLLSQHPGMPGYKMLWGWIVLACGGVLQIVTALWASFCAPRWNPLPAEAGASPELVAAPDPPPLP